MLAYACNLDFKWLSAVPISTGKGTGCWRDRVLVGVRAKHLPPPKATPKRPWISQATLTLIEERNVTGQELTQPELSELNKKVKQSAREDRKQWVQRELKDTSNSQSELTRWSWIKRLRKPYAVHSTVLKNEQGDKCNMKDTAEEFPIAVISA